MIIYYIIQYSLLLIICIYLVNYYAAKTVSFHIKFWSVITWVLNFAIALLVPQDVYQTLNPTQKNLADHKNTLSTLGWQYLILYWLVYILTWTIIPVLQQWENSGDLDSNDRLKRSLKINGYFYLWMIVGAVIFLIILIWFNVGGQMGLITFLKCLATIWGLFLLMGLMGYALVQIPKTLWSNADPENLLKYLYMKVNQVQDELQESYQQFTKIVGFIIYTQNETSKLLTQESQKIQLYCKESIKIIPEQYTHKVLDQKNYFEFLSQIGYLNDNPVNLQSSIQHLRLLKRSIAHCKRSEKSFDYYCIKAILYQDILKSLKRPKQNNNDQIIQDHGLDFQFKKITIGGSIVSIEQDLLQNMSKQQNIKPLQFKLYTQLFKSKWYHSLWYLKLRPYVNKFLSILIGTGSLILLVAQSQVFLTKKSSILAWLLAIQNYEMLRIIVFIVIVFIMYMVNYSLFRLKLSNLYGLYYQNSDGPSLMFATVNFSRVGVVIVLNFFDMMKIDSQYKAVMGTVDMGLLGQWVIKGLPGVLWLIVLTHYFNVWGKLMNFLKLSDSFSFSSHDVSTVGISNKGLRAVQRKRKLLQEKMWNQMQNFQKQNQN